MAAVCPPFKVKYSSRKIRSELNEAELSGNAKQSLSHRNNHSQLMYRAVQHRRGPPSSFEAIELSEDPESFFIGNGTTESFVCGLSLSGLPSSVHD